MIDSYINRKLKSNLSKKQWENFWFGLCFGLVLILIFSIRYLTSVKDLTNDDFFLVGMSLGAVFVLASIIYPNLLEPIRKLLYFISNILIKALFSSLLTVIYFLFVFPFSFIIKSKQKIEKNDSTNFVDYSCQETFINVNKNSFLYQIARIFKFFINENYFIFIPLLIVLIIISIILVFVQSSAIAPFIYTIF